MASREESVDVSISAALIKIGEIDKALTKATKATVNLNVQAAMAKVKTLDAALTKATTRRSLTFDTARAQAQIRALDRQLSRVGTTGAGGEAGAVNRATQQRVLASRATAQQIAAINRNLASTSIDAENKIAGARRVTAQQISAINSRIASSAAQTADAEIAAARRKQTSIDAINRNIAALQRNQAATAARSAEATAAQSIARQRAVLSAQLSQVRSLQNIGQQLTFGLSLPIAAAGVAVAKLGFNFEDTINRIRVLTTPAFRVSTKAVDDLRASILALSGSTGRTPTELAEGFYQIASAGLAGAKSLDVLEAAAQAATIGLGDTNTVADIASSVLNAYGDSAGNAFQVTNTLAEAVRIAKGEASDFAPVLGRLLPVAKNLGISFSDVAGSVALLTRNGLSASEATTQLRGLFNSFIKPSVQARKELDRVGLSSSQLLQQLQAGDFIGALSKIRDAFGSDQLGLGRLFRNQQGLNAFLSLTRDLPATAKALNDVAKAGENANREVTGFSLIKSSPTVQFRFALAQLQAELLKIGTSLGPILVNFARFGGTILGFVNSLGSFGRIFFGIAAGLALISGPAILVFTAIRRLQIAQQQLAIASGEATGAMEVESAAMSSQTGVATRLGNVLRGQTGILTKFAGAIGALSAIAIAPQLGAGLANATSGTEKFTAVLGIAGAAAGAFFAGSAVGSPILGGVASAATLAAGAIGFFGEQAKNQKRSLDSFRDSLVGITDAAKIAATVGGNLPTLLRDVLLKGDKLGQLEFKNLEDAGINFRDFGTALTTGGSALARFNKEAANKIAVVQLKQINDELAKAKGNSANVSDEAFGLLKILREAGAAKLGGNFGEITNQAKALDVLRAAAEKDMGAVAKALGIPIGEAKRLTELLGGTEDALTGTGDAADDGAAGLEGFGSAADGAAVSIQDLEAGLDAAITAAEELNNVKLDAFATQADAAAGLADLFETLDKNKQVLPQLGQNFDLTSEKGRLLAKANADVVDGFTKQIQGAEESARGLLTQADGVNKATFAYTGFFNQLHDVAIAAGLTEDQFNTLATTIGATPTQVFADWSTAGVDATSKVNTAIDTLLGAIPPAAADAVRAIQEPSDQVAALATQLSLLPPETVATVIASVTNADTVDVLAEVIQDLPPETQAKVLALTAGLPDVQALTEQIVSDLPPETIATVLASVQGTPAVDGLNTAIADLPASTIAAVLAAVQGTPAVAGLDAAIKKLPASKQSQVAAIVSGHGAVEGLDLAIQRLHDKTVTVRVLTVAQGRGAVQTGTDANGNPIFGAKGMMWRGGVQRMQAGGINRGPMIAHVRQGRGILWAEPETMGESYIPWSMRHRERAKRILGLTASHFGMMLVPAVRRAASGLVLDQRITQTAQSQAINSLARSVSQQQPASSGVSGPLVGQVVVETPTQTPQAMAVEVAGAVGARLFARLNER